MRRPLFRAQESKAAVTALEVSAPMGARIFTKILRQDLDGGVRFRCFASTHITSLVRGSSSSDEVLR